MNFCFYNFYFLIFFFHFFFFCLCDDFQTTVPGIRNSLVLQNLLPDTPYNVTVEAIYADGVGGSLNGNGKTRETTLNLLSFSDLCTKSLVEQKWTASFKRIIGHECAKCFHTMLVSLCWSGTCLTTLNFSAVGMLSPRNLRVSDEWYTRFRVAWDPVPVPVQGYRIIYSPAGECWFFFTEINHLIQEILEEITEPWTCQ